MAYPFPSTSPSQHSQYLTVHTPRSRSNSRHAHHHRSHSHSGHRDHAVYPQNLVYATAGDYQHPVHRHPSHHSPHHHSSHSTHHLPHYVQSTPSTHSHLSHTHSHHSYAPTHHHHRERTPSFSDRIRNFFGMDRSDQYSHHHHYQHQPHHQPIYHTHSDNHRRRHNSFSSFRDEPRIHRSNSVRTGPLFFGAVDNRRYLDEHGREVDHHGRVIHRM